MNEESSQGDEVRFRLLAIFGASFSELVVGCHLELCDEMFTSDNQHKPTKIEQPIASVFVSPHGMHWCFVWFLRGGLMPHILGFCARKRGVFAFGRQIGA